MPSTFYIDLVNGNDSNTGADWANAWKTITSGATAARIAAGDTIRISKTADPTSIGNGLWRSTSETAGGFPAAKNISAMADNGSGAVRITANSHGFVDDDIVQIVGLVTTGTTYETNGDWLITKIDNNTFDLQGSTYVNTRASGGTAQKINSKCVYLATAQTLTITTCNIKWTGANDGTPDIVLTATDAKKGGSCAKITLDSSAQANKLQGYFATGTISGATLNSYSKLTFWFKNSAVITDATTWYIALCSDTAGATPIDYFPIPAIPSTGRWIPFTIGRCDATFATTGNCGGNSSTDVKSIALYSGATAPANSSNVLMDNFEVCTTSGLNLQSLISKNSAAYGGTEGWYGIQSIQGRIVILDNDTNTKSNAGRGYWSATASDLATTYIRETFKTSMASSSSTVISDCTDSGSVGSVITYSGGWNTSTNLQDGDTFMDGLNGHGYGLRSSGRSYVNVERLEMSRYNYGINLTSSSEIMVTNTNTNNNSTGVYVTNSSDNKITTANNNNNTYGIYVASSSEIIVTNTNTNNNSTGVYVTNSSDNKITTANNNNNTYGIYLSFSSNNTVTATNTNNNSSGGIYQNSGINFLRGCTVNESIEVGGWQEGTKGQLRSINHDNTAGNNWVFANYATANWQTSTKHDTEPGSWKCIISNAARNSAYKFDLEVAKIACAANKLVTVKAWVKKDHATNVACSIDVYADTVTGVASDGATTKADDTDWQELTLTFTPVNGGVVPIVFNTWYVAGNSNTYIGALTITQAT